MKEKKKMKLRMKERKENKGITLIALVITIIVLLILAAVSIATLTGENGILNQATKAGERTTEETEKEELKLSFNAAKSKKYEKGDYTGEITAKDLEDELKKQNPKVQVKESSNPIEVTFPSGNVYTVDGKTGEIKGPTNKQGDTPTPPTEENLAKEVLQIDPEADEYYKKSPYVKYNGILCRVFYNDEKHGLQIISADNVGKVTLGSEDPNVQASDFAYEGSANVNDNFKKAAASYNKAVGTLNEEARKHMSETDKMDGTDGNKIAIDARSLGSIATLKDGKFQLDDVAPMYPSEGDTTYEYFTTYNLKGKLKNTDTNYEEDADSTTGQLRKLGLNATSYTWLASRFAKAQWDSTHFMVRYVDVFHGNATYVYDLCYVNEDDRASSNSYSKGFRPVFLLSYKVKIKSGGDGTSNNPYELEI